MIKEYKRLIEKEGNRKQFEYKGVKALILRVRPDISGHLCGYVQIDKKLDPLDYNEYNNHDIDVHGGLTFSGELLGEEGHWEGFDCIHLGDIAPMREDNEMWVSFGDTYKNMKYVETEIKTMIDQFIEKGLL